MTKQKMHKYTDESFKNLNELQDFFRAGKTLKYDYVIVDGILYTMHEYDMDGQYVTWANKRHEKMFQVQTQNRYGDNGYLDAEITDLSPAGYLRNDIIYAD